MLVYESTYKHLVGTACTATVPQLPFHIERSSLISYDNTCIDENMHACVCVCVCGDYKEVGWNNNTNFLTRYLNGHHPTHYNSVYGC